MGSDAYVPPEESPLSPGEWLATERDRLSRLGLESGQKIVVRFGRNSREDTFEVLERFEREAQPTYDLEGKAHPKNAPTRLAHCSGLIGGSPPPGPDILGGGTAAPPYRRGGDPHHPNKRGGESAYTDTSP